MMKKIKNPLIFSLVLLPIAALAGYLVAMYQFELYNPEMIDTLISQVGSIDAVITITVIQTVIYTFIFGFFGYSFSEKVGLIKPFRIEKDKIVRTLFLSIGFGIIFSLDYWTFGAWIPSNDIREATVAGLTLYGWLGSIFYGGIIEELMMRFFIMSLIVWLIWKLFLWKKETIPTGVYITANVIAALLFAAGHLPATVALFDKLTPLVLFRCFLLNGGFGLFFGWLYRKYGIQYSMISHAMLHVVSKTIWLIFI